MLGRPETRRIVIETRNKGRDIRIEMVQQWRAGFEMNYEIYVDGEKTQENMKAEDAMRWRGNALMDGS